MAYEIKKFGELRERRSFSKFANSIDLKDLLEVQKSSYEWFLNEGITEVFGDLFPVESFSNILTLELGDYNFGEPVGTIKEAKDKETTYAAPLRATARLINNETGDVKEQEVFLGDMPVMTETGTFIINGAERVIISQLVRSPSVYFARI